MVKCKKCKVQFYARPSHIKMGYGKYCSRSCHYDSMRNGKKVSCHICNKEVYKTKQKLLHSKSKKYFCGKSCQTIWRNSYFSKEKHSNWKGGESTYRNILTKSKILKICKACGIEDMRVLVVHHLDQNRKNNNLTNLVWLCHNCHHTVHHGKVIKKKIMETLV